MIKTISGKHVMLSMVNGIVLEGFVYQMDDGNDFTSVASEGAESGWIVCKFHRRMGS